jgi:hypothetical protein
MAANNKDSMFFCFCLSVFVFFVCCSPFVYFFLLVAAAAGVLHRYLKSITTPTPHHPVGEVNKPEKLRVNFSGS